VTGAGEGIGLGASRRLAAAGARVVVAERSTDTGSSAADVLRRDFDVEARFVATDVTDKAQMQAAVAAAVDGFGRLDVLVNNAWAGGTMGRLEHKTDEAMEHGFRMAYWPAYWAMQAAFPTMRAQGRGRIVSMCSLNGVNAHPFTAEYNAGKEALRALTRTAAREWARHGITANVVCPAAATAAFRAVQESMPEMIADILRENPMGRMGDPEVDIGGVVAFLAGDDAGYLTGNTLFVDGGSHINGVSWAPELPD
jgi:NAD(P)-dependent dehydrogenase (short-subunit alcohol dehydrogenase family)